MNEDQFDALINLINSDIELAKLKMVIGKREIEIIKFCISKLEKLDIHNKEDRRTVYGLATIYCNGLASKSNYEENKEISLKFHDLNTVLNTLYYR